MTGDKKMASSMAVTDEQQIVRPLRVLVPLIQDDLQHGKEAADRAGMPYYCAAGEKLLEAKAQLKHGEFQAWVKRHFTISLPHARYYMRLAENEGARSFSSISEFIRETSQPSYNRPPKPPSWQEPVKRIIDRVDTETLNLKRAELKRADERDAQRELALRLINIGYKVLARTLHPDKGGSRDAMARLNSVRDRLKQHA